MLEDSINNINNFNWNLVVLKKLLKCLKFTIFPPNLRKTGVPIGHAPNNFFSEIKPDHISLQKLFISSKCHMFLLSCECFSIWCDVFLLKSVISSHSSCVLVKLLNYLQCYLIKAVLLKAHSQVWDNFWQLKALKVLISHQKLFSFSRYLSLSLDNLVIWENDLIRKIRLISNFMMSRPG